MNRYLSLDVGIKTVGLAISDGYIASPYGTIKFNDNDFLNAVSQLIEIIDQEQITVLVVGYPKNMNNSIGERALMVEEFVKLLSKMLPSPLPINLVDERWTTKTANNIMLEADLSRKKRKQYKDSLAAQIILETFLNKLNL